MGWVSLILSPESKILLQQHITGFVTHSPNPGATERNFKSSALPASMFLSQSL